MRKGIKTLAVWALIGIIFIVLISSVMENSDRKLSYSELVYKIESNEVEKIEISSSRESALVQLKGSETLKEVIYQI